MSQNFTTFANLIDNPQVPGVQDVSPQEVKDKAASLKLIDVRRPNEYTGELGHIAGTELIVLDTLEDRLSEVPKDQTVVFVCRSGGRSAAATAHALEQGYQSVYNMAGGMIAWNELGFPIEK